MIIPFDLCGTYNRDQTLLHVALVLRPHLPTLKPPLLLQLLNSRTLYFRCNALWLGAFYYANPYLFHYLLWKYRFLFTPTFSETQLGLGMLLRHIASFYKRTFRLQQNVYTSIEN
jgi:hypothetical protein